MEIFLQQVLNGLSIASVIALVAVGITMIFGLTRIVNFAHGELLMVGGYAVWWIVTNAGIGGERFGLYIVGFVIAVLLVGAFGFTLERGLFRFTLDSPINGFIVSIGLIIILQHFVADIFTSEQQAIQKPIETVWDVGGVRVSAMRIFVIGATAALVVGLYLGINKSRWGRALRASAADRDTAALMGIPVRRYIMLVFFAGSAIAGLGGALLIGLFPITPFIGSSFVIKGFAVAIIGGLGNVTGAVIAAILLGLLESMGAGYFAPGWVNAYAFGLMIVILLVRPQGLLRGSADAQVS